MITALAVVEVKSMERRFTAVFRKEGKWWIAYAEEIPGANTQGRTLKEARENLKEAIALMIEANRELAEDEAPAGKTVREEILVKTE